MAELNINEVIADNYSFRESYLYRDGFAFTLGQNCPAVFNRILIRSPKRARADETRMGYSPRTLDEHIELINKYQIEKAKIICNDLSFIKKCPSLNDIEVFPAYSASADFDYSVLYEMPNIKTLSCQTVYGYFRQRHTTIDYSKIKGIENVAIYDHWHTGFEKVTTLKHLWISGNKKIHDLNGISCSPVLQELTFLQCGIQSLFGIENYKTLKSLTLWNNKSLRDISNLGYISETLTELSIEACSKIKDFTVLNNLVNLEHLHLEGNNTLPNLDFLKQMKRLKTFVFTMNVEDGNLNNCKAIPYVSCKNRRHYNLKDADLPKINNKETQDDGFVVDESNN